jgi:hypothetical protein
VQLHKPKKYNPILPSNSQQEHKKSRVKVKKLHHIALKWFQSFHNALSFFPIKFILEYDNLKCHLYSKYYTILMHQRFAFHDYRLYPTVGVRVASHRARSSREGVGLSDQTLLRVQRNELKIGNKM